MPEPIFYTGNDIFVVLLEHVAIPFNGSPKADADGEVRTRIDVRSSQWQPTVTQVFTAVSLTLLTRSYNTFT